MEGEREREGRCFQQEGIVWRRRGEEEAESEGGREGWRERGREREGAFNRKV